MGVAFEVWMTSWLRKRVVLMNGGGDHHQSAGAVVAGVRCVCGMVIVEDNAMRKFGPQVIFLMSKQFGFLNHYYGVFRGCLEKKGD